MTDVIRKTSEKEKLGRFELMKLREIRRDLVRTKKLANTLAYLKNKRIDPNPPKVSEVKKIYGNRFTNDFVGGNYLEMFNVLYNEYESILTEEEKINFRLFKILLDTKNKTVHLSDLYKLTYKNIYSPEEIERRISNPEELSKFFDKLNGCLLEETVANIDLKNMDISNLGTIKVDYGTDIDPLVLVKAITPVPMVQVNDQPEQEMTFVIFSDVHLDQNCYREENGIMVVDSEKLNRNLSAFAEFKKGLVKSLGGVSGIIYTGDVLDGFFDKNKGRITVKTISNLSGEFVRFARKRKIAEKNNQSNPSEETQVNEIEATLSDDASFVAYLAGNHDMRLGRRKFEKIMRLFERNIIDPRAVSLGNGSARIKIGEEFISLMHHNSLDWGLLDNSSKRTRQAKNRASFRFQEYFEICKAFYGEPGSEERMRFDQEYLEARKLDPNIGKVYFLTKKVNDKMKVENPDLYYFYLPYIIPNSEFLDKTDVVDLPKQKMIKPKKGMGFFRNFIDMGVEDELKIREKGVGKRLFPSVDVYKTFANNDNEQISFTERLTNAVKELNNPKYKYNVIPQFGRNDAYTPKLISLAHFHSALSNEKKDGSGGRVKSHSPTQGNGINKKWFLNAMVQQDQGMLQKEATGDTRLSAMVYHLKLNANKIAEISVTPYKWRTNVNQPLTLDIKSGETITYKSR